MMLTVNQVVAREARRQEESCLYTSTILYMWLRQVRFQHSVFIVAPIILGALASFSVFKQNLPPWVIASLALLASLFPALASALKIQTNVNEITSSAASFKRLQDRFRQLADLAEVSADTNFEEKLDALMNDLDAARSKSITAPERYFGRARKKIEGGDYTFSADSNS